MTELFTVTFFDLLFIPTSLGLTVYILSMASGLKLFKKLTLPWMTSLIALILCVMMLPFFELYITVPIGVAILYLAYMKMI